MALILIVVFFTCRPTTLARKGIFVTQFGTVLLSTMSLFLYVMVGGSLRPVIFLGGLFFGGSPEVHQSMFSYGGGAAVLLFSILWAWTLPLWSIWAIKLKYCEDHITEADERDEEAAELMAEIRYEASQLDPETAQAILHPVTARNIIDWYNAPK